MVDNISIEVEQSTQSRISTVDFSNLGFGRVFSDHMLIADYKDGEWLSCKIQPFQELSLSPATAVLHYGQSIFEGLKAQYTIDGSIAIFRPWENHKRMIFSAERMCMPPVPEEFFIGGMKRLLELDKAWIPKNEGTSLYIRPFLFATEPFLGVRPSSQYKFIIFTSPVGSYYSEPVNLKIEKHFSRVAQGGMGAAKTAGNYAASLYGAVQGQKQGFHQLLWTNTLTHEYLEEVGTMNIMFRRGNQIVTPALGDSILRGITRDSVLTLAKDWGYEVEERKIKVTELVDGLEDKSIEEVFGVGTAAVVSHINTIHHEGTTYTLPPIEQRVFANKVLDTFTKLKYGQIEDKYNWLMKI